MTKPSLIAYAQPRRLTDDRSTDRVLDSAGRAQIAWQPSRTTIESDKYAAPQPLRARSLPREEDGERTYDSRIRRNLQT